MELPSKPSSSSSRPNSTQATQSSGEPQPQFVTVFDTSKSLSDTSKSLSDAPARARCVIPPIPNANLFRLDTTSADPAGLTLRSNSATAADTKRGDGWRRAEAVMFDRFHKDISRLPEDRGFAEFADIPVHSYAAFFLSRFGWSKGSGIGRKRKIGEVQSSDSEKIGAGRHAGQKGTVVERSGRKIMLQSSEEVQVGDDMVAELGSAAEDKCLKKLKKLEISDRDERKRKEERKRDDKRDERRDIDEEAKPVENFSGGGGGVRGGKIYEQKGEVVGPRTCDITMDGSGELVQGVDQEMLETSQPKYGGFVLVLYEKHTGVFGSSVERDMEEETGVIRDADSHAPIDVRLDKIAEYVEDPSH